MQLNSNRLIISSWEAQHAAAFFELSQDAGFNLFPITIYRQANVESARDWIMNSKTKWGVWEKQSGELIGIGGLTPWQLGADELVDITYRLRESNWGQGYGLELARALVKYGFTEMGLQQITATITPDNEASKKIAAKLGMVFDQHILLKNVPTDVYRLKLKDKETPPRI
jgi:RimJ/RimL family protein N-acetyltransferase